MIADSTASFRYQGKPNADRARAVGGVLARPEGCRTACSAGLGSPGGAAPGRPLALGLHLSRRVASGPATGGWWRQQGGLHDGKEGFPGVGVGGYHHGDRPGEDAEEDLQAR